MKITDERSSASTVAHAHGGEALASTLAALSGAPDTSERPPAVPSGAARYVLHGVLGQGGMGRVHDAEDLQFGRRVALKELVGGETELARRFAVEAIVTGNLEHPGIPAVYERGEREGRAFYTMKKLSGRALSEVIERTGSLEDRLALVPIAIQVAHTLGFAHERGIVHRDVKPDNVMIGAHGEVWVVDWGIAKVRGRDDRPSDAARAASDVGTDTMHGSVMGTPAYMAPEQARGEVAAIDERTDVFALGALLHHLLVGRPPFEGPTAAAVLAASLDGRRALVRSLAPAVPEALAAIVERAMAPAPKDRFADAGAVARALERFVAQAALEKPPLAARAMAAMGSVLAVLFAAFGTAMTVANVASLREQGPVAYWTLFFSLVGMGLSVLEWRTQGRLRVLPLASGIAAATFVGGVGATIQAYGTVARNVHERMAPADWSGALLDGVWEASGIGALSCQLAVVQFVAIALAARATRLHEDRARTSK